LSMELSMERNDKLYEATIASDANDRIYDHIEYLAHASVNAANKLYCTYLLGSYGTKCLPTTI
jgi:hypothetical protein